MNINRRIENLESAAAKLRTQRPPPPRFDYSHFSDDEVVSISELFRRIGMDAVGGLNLSNATEYELVELATIQSRLAPEK